MIMRVHNSLMKNWITERPQTDTLVNETNYFTEELYFNLGEGSLESFNMLSRIINRVNIMDQSTLIREYSISDPEADLERHF